MPSFTDQTGRSIQLKQIPKRIISLVPSQTELLAELGLAKEVIGITKFCIHPREWFINKPKVGGTKKLIMDKIHTLKPDLIIANKEENVKEEVEDLEQHYPVWTSDVMNLADAYEMIRQVGIITGKEQPAAEITSRIKKGFSQLQPIKHNPRTIYLIWQKPYMTIGADTFIHSMLETAGFKNIFSHRTRYPEVTIEELKELQPDILFLSSEPFPFNQQHADGLSAHLPGTRILLVNGEMFSWYGSRLLFAPAYFSELVKQVLPVRPC